MLKLQITNTEGDSRILEFEDFPVSIGRDSGSGIVTDDSKTSRHHAAFEMEEGQLYFCDKGSSNGSFLNSTRVERELAGPGDKVRLGNTRIRIVAVEELREELELEEDVPEEGLKNSDLAASLARRRRSTMLGPVVVLLVIGLGVYWYLNWEMNKQPPVVEWTAADIRHGEAVEKVRKFIWESGHAESVTPDFLNRLEDARNQYGDVEFYPGETSFDDLDRLLRERRKMDVNNRLYTLISQQESCLRKKEWARLFSLVEEQGKEIIAISPQSRKKIELLRENSRKAAEEEFTELSDHAGYLEGLGQVGEAIDTIVFARKHFQGTKYEEQFATLLVETRSRISQRREKQKERVTRRRQELLGKGAVASRVEEKPLSPTELLVEKLKPWLSAFDLVGPVEEIDATKLVTLSAQKLEGKDLLLAARFAFKAKLKKEADDLVLKYLGKEEEEECTADTAAARLLADSRGLAKVPGGGFSYTRGHGWEDAGDTLQRLALVESGKLLKKFSLVKSEKKLTGYFDEVLAVMSKPGLRAEGKERKLMEKTSKGLDRMVKKAAFSSLKKARQELDQRRAAAISVIYDSKIYLPENHPDWKDGDEVNGQKEVDAAVDRVRELWNNAASFAIKLDKSTNALSELIRVIEEDCYARLKYDPGEDDKAGIEELRNNLDRRIDLKSFAVNREDLESFNYNRKVEAYNRSLKKADIAETDKQHAVVLNDYREMMGRRRLFLDERLCRACLKHSRVCDAAKKIWHNGSEGNPSSRAKAAGFPTGVGENIAIGYDNPEETWTRGWYRASDHHRNGLGERWTCLGYGYAGRVGTQNFAAIELPSR